MIIHLIGIIIINIKFIGGNSDIESWSLTGCFEYIKELKTIHFHVNKNENKEKKRKHLDSRRHFCQFLQCARHGVFCKTA